MKDNKYKSMAQFMKVVLTLLIIFGGILCCYIIGATIFSEEQTNKDLNFFINCFLFIIGGSSLLVILYNLKKILDSVIKVTPFIMNNVICLNRIAKCCFIISGTYILNLIFNDQYRKLKIVSLNFVGVDIHAEFIMFFFAGCFILVLAQVYKQAVEVKEENDFTI
ncbi:MAG: DUF2975 domain-containing protein [Clostridiaceae bacterium]|nr:DUF2975 domain-containing protein [Clostridiaceae bacterium]